jgi:hypothetical protein
MKAIRLFLLSSGLVLSFTALLRAQQLPTPQHPGEWIVREVAPRFRSEMPIRKPEINLADKSIKTLKQVPIDPRTGQLIGIYDAERGLRYDFENGLISDTRNGKLYQFYRKGEQPKPYPPQSASSAQL